MLILIMMGSKCGQIFIQDISVSVVIAMLTILSLIAYISFHNQTFEKQIRNEHKSAIIERIAQKLFLSNEYSFNIREYEVDSTFIQFIQSLNNKDKYENVRTELALNREGIAYDLMVRVNCGDGKYAEGGIETMNNPLSKTIIVITEDNTLCNVNIKVSER